MAEESPRETLDSVATLDIHVIICRALTEQRIFDFIAREREMEVVYTNNPGENENKNRVEREEEQEDSLDENRVLCQLGERVFVIRDPKLGVDRLCKIHRGEMNQEFIDELYIVHNLRHARMTSIEEVKANDEGYAIIYKTNNGNLKDLITREGLISEERVAEYFRQVVEVVQYCHSNSVGLGNNIRLTNFVFDDDRNSVRMDLLQNPIDVTDSNMTSNRLYNPAYCSPEAVPWWGPYDVLKADVWSCGILLYALLTGTYPYMDEKIDKQLLRISLQPLPMPNNVSSSARTLLQMLLKKDPDERITLDQALCHPWLRRSEPVDLYTPLI